MSSLSGGVFERCGAPKQYVDGLSRPNQFLLRDDMSAETRTKKTCACPMELGRQLQPARRLPTARAVHGPAWYGRRPLGAVRYGSPFMAILWQPNWLTPMRSEIAEHAFASKNAEDV